MRIVVHQSPREYWDAALPMLLEREAENCLAIGIAHFLVHEQPDAKCPLFSVQEGERTLAAGWLTPRHPLGLTELPPEAVPLVVDLAQQLGAPVSAVVAPAATASSFSDAWQRARGCTIQKEISQRIFQATTIVRAAPVPGTFRQATDAERGLLEDWHHAFMVECHLGDDRQAAAEFSRQGIATGSRYVWAVGTELVSMVGFGGPTPNGIRVNWVYTPPELRGRGYASAVVAAMSQKLLDEGRKFCFLYTDLSNPTSNSIYQKLGYRPVCDSMHITFWAESSG